MAELDSTLRTRFAQIIFTANAQKTQTDTGLANDTGLKNPAFKQAPKQVPVTQPLATRDVTSAMFSVLPNTPKPKTPIAPPPELNLSIFTTQTLATTLENLRTHVDYLLRLPLPVRVKNRLRLKFWAMSRRFEAVNLLLELEGVDKLSIDPNCFNVSEFNLSHFNLSGEDFQGD